MAIINNTVNGLVLTGGGARVAYQTGVLSAISDISREKHSQCPFQVITGTSAGAINAACVASYHDNFQTATQLLSEMWGTIHTNRVFRVDSITLISRGLRSVLDMVLGRLGGNNYNRGLLDTSPLIKLLKPHLRFNAIQEHIDAGQLRALGITAVNYANGTSKTFFQAHDDCLPWHRMRRQAEKTNIHLKHIMASTALPILFPPVKINNRYYGDGSLRNYTPLSSAIKLGATKLMVIGARQSEPSPHQPKSLQDSLSIPSVGKIIGVLINTLLLDAIDFDCERLSRINHTITQLSDQHSSQLRPIDVLVIRPSEDLGRLALDAYQDIPPSLRHFINSLGKPEASADLVSYLLFEPSYTQRLIQLGYADAMKKKTDIQLFLS
ncbi:patatin-like phospholipase family protein [Candidatus Marinamargulisbacteria bacterium]|jgi:NTE family protein|nr:patatin-like phospholipase family protein [Candidatus Marinamargulisbacteria bacterium]